MDFARLRPAIRVSVARDGPPRGRVDRSLRRHCAGPKAGQARPEEARQDHRSPKVAEVQHPCETTGHQHPRDISGRPYPTHQQARGRRTVDSAPRPLKDFVKEATSLGRPACLDCQACHNVKDAHVSASGRLGETQTRVRCSLKVSWHTPILDSGLVRRRT